MRHFLPAALAGVFLLVLLLAGADRFTAPEAVPAPPRIPAAAAAASGIAGPDADCGDALRLEYTSGSTRVWIEDGCLLYAFSEHRVPRGRPALQTSQYDVRREVEVALSPVQMALLRRWQDTHGPFSLRPPDGRRAPPGYGVAFGERLRVTCGDLDHDLGWNGDSRWSDPGERERVALATEALIGIARQAALPGERTRSAARD